MKKELYDENYKPVSKDVIQLDTRIPKTIARICVTEDEAKNRDSVKWIAISTDSAMLIEKLFQTLEEIEHTEELFHIEYRDAYCEFFDKDSLAVAETLRRALNGLGSGAIPFDYCKKRPIMELDRSKDNYFPED